jgi:hypothetical protein
MYSELAFFKYLRTKVFKIDKPYALPWGGWELWDKDLRETRPFAFFITETLPGWLELPGRWIVDPINDVVYYLRLRFVSKTHIMRTDLPKGKWHEFETRLLHSVFTELIDFVEIEQARMNVTWGDDKNRAKYNAPWWHQYRILRWKRWRSATAGVDYLRWCMSLQEDNQMTRQADAGYELMCLYTWWKYVRPARKDEWDETGLRAFWHEMDIKYGDNWLLSNAKGTRVISRQEEATYRRLSDASDALTQARHKEDEDALIRVVKLRQSLWT